MTKQRGFFTSSTVASYPVNLTASRAKVYQKAIARLVPFLTNLVPGACQRMGAPPPLPLSIPPPPVPFIQALLLTRPFRKVISAQYPPGLDQLYDSVSL